MRNQNRLWYCVVKFASLTCVLFFCNAAIAEDSEDLDKEISELTKCLESLQEQKKKQEKIKELKGQIEALRKELGISGDDQEKEKKEETKPKSGELGTVVFGQPEIPKKPTKTGWYKDPTGKNEYRLFEEDEWSPDVLNQDKLSKDPIVEGEPFLPTYGELGLRKWELDWQFGKGGTRFVYDIGTRQEGEVNAFDDGEINFALDFLTLYARNSFFDTRLDWGPTVGFGIASANKESTEAALLMWNAGLFLRPSEKNWQLEWGFIQGISGDESRTGGLRDDSALYFGLTIGAIHDSAKDGKKK